MYICRCMYKTISLDVILGAHLSKRFQLGPLTLTIGDNCIGETYKRKWKLLFRVKHLGTLHPRMETRKETNMENKWNWYSILSSAKDVPQF